MPPMRNDPFQRLGLDREVLTVSQLNQRARLLLEDVFPQVWVEGELSNLARPASGHVYFTLKDSNAQIRCALFRQNALRVRQALRDGLAVKVRGKISLFEGRGDYQLIADTVEPAGDGALRLAFEALKEKLAGEGLFASERKRPLPAHPRRIGIVSSPSGAVIRDIISVFRRRAPQVELTLVPTAVQGREAVAQIVRALQLADRQGFDALILARGGGSLEDLWCFNEEAVARSAGWASGRQRICPASISWLTVNSGMKATPMPDLTKLVSTATELVRSFGLSSMRSSWAAITASWPMPVLLWINASDSLRSARIGTAPRCPARAWLAGMIRSRGWRVSTCTSNSPSSTGA